MEQFIFWLFNSFYDVINTLSYSTVNMINGALLDWGEDTQSLMSFDINLVLFSDTSILSSNAWDLSLLFFSIFYSIIFITIVWKIIKKVFTKITGWNKW